MAVSIHLAKYGGWTLKGGSPVVQIPDHKARDLIRDLAAQLRERHHVD